MRDLGAPSTANSVEHRIDTGDSLPINGPPYRASPKEREIIEKQKEENLKKGIISESKVHMLPQ